MEGKGAEYYLGLDMGTTSVGWAVTDVNYNLLRARGKDLWGIREFEEAATAVERRTHRISRRRRQREVVRIGLVTDYFHDEIEKIDPFFLQRLANSKYHLEDKDEPVKNRNGVFNDKNYTDKEYYKQYPTVFHLRKELLESNQEHDVRLVYLAIINMFKHRGHFLNATIGSETKEAELKSAYNSFREQIFDLFNINFVSCDCSQIEEILSSKDYSRSKKAEELANLLAINMKDKQQMGFIKCICGLKVDIKLLFGEQVETEDKKLDICFTDIHFEEKIPELLSAIGEDNYEIVNCMKEIFDIGSLAGIMKGHNYLSQARVSEYEKHKMDLAILKKVVKKYSVIQEYDNFFRKAGDGTYCAYVNSTNSKQKSRRDMKERSRDDFYGGVKKLIKTMPQEDTAVQYILEEISKETFMPKQLTASNGVIPNQIHLREMKKILSNAECYLPFLSEMDDTGLTTSERILKLFSFQIPYFIGPVSENSAKSGGNGWVVRKESGQILPWNIEDKIDMKSSAEEFISRLVRRCTYLSGETVLPKCSLVYERFCVLNEINNLKVYGEKIPVQIKQDIFSELFEKGKKVTRKQLCKYLLTRGIIKDGEYDQITGIDIAINNSLSSYGKFLSIFGDKLREDKYKEMSEQIIFWCTVYGDTKSFLKEQLVEKYGSVLNTEQIKRIMSFKFKDWSKLSGKFLHLNGCSKNTGETMSLIQMMWETNDNLMELLSKDKYTYREELEKMQDSAYRPLNEMQPEDLDEMYFSAPVKRMVWQTLQIIKELEKIMGNPPERLFVEMTRSEDKEKKRTESRKQQFLNLYKSIKDDDKNWKKIIEDADSSKVLRSKKMYLYLTQKGRCMYTGDAIDLEQLFDDNKYDIDHIYPRHFVKDDNIANNLVLVRKETNAHKSDSYPLEEAIFSRQLMFWKELRRQNLISEEKFVRLTGRNPFTDEQKAGFIARQLVETSQGTKGVTSILEGALPDTKIVYAKASNVSEFRQSRKLPKSRSVNDFHHAQDAYLNIVVGNAYFVKFTQNPMNFIVKEYDRDKSANNYNLSKMFDWDIKRGEEVAWVAQHGKDESGTIVTVKKVMSKNTPLLTRLSFEGHGGIADQTLYSAKKAQGCGYYPIKSSDSKMNDVTKYGGLSSATTAYFFLVEHEEKGKQIRTLETVPVLWKDRIEKDETALQTYCEQELGLKSPSIRLKKIKLQSLVKKDGYYMQITGKTGNRIYGRNAVQLSLDIRWIGYIKKIEKCIERNDIEKEIIKEKNIELFDIIAEKHRASIFSKRPNPLEEKFELYREKYCELEELEQCKVIMQLLKLTAVGLPKADLTAIGGTSSVGIMRINKNICGAKEFLLVNQSVTGIFEKRIDLLKV